MIDELDGQVRKLADRILSVAEHDALLRADLVALARIVLARFEADSPDAITSEEDAVAGPLRPLAESQAAPPEPVSSLPGDVLDELQSRIEEELFRPNRTPAAAEPAAYPARWTPPSDDDLPLIEARCRLKAEAARWSATRRRRMAEGADYHQEIAPVDRDLISRAKAMTDCFLWTSSSQWQPPDDSVLIEELATSFEVLQSAVALVRLVLSEGPSDNPLFEQSLDVLAEAQSALRIAVERVNDRPDADQNAAFAWLRVTTQEQGVLVTRHMRLDDPADPANSNDLLARINTLDGKIQEQRGREKGRAKLLQKTRYHARQLSDNKGSADEHWRTIARAVDELVASGTPPSNKDIRDALLPIIGELPVLEEVPSGFDKVLTEIERYWESQPPPEAARLEQGPTAEVLEVARLLGGKRMVLIGGIRNPAAQSALVRAFGLTGIDWISTREHSPLSRFEAAVQRPDVGVVLLAIRWSSHSYGAVKDFCDTASKPFVRLPAGYSPNRVALEILQQCGERLRRG